MNIIDLDDIDTNIGVLVKIQGVEYAVKEPSLRATIAMSKMSELAQSDDEDKQEQGYEKMIEMVQGMIPDCPKAVIDTLSINKIAVIMNGVSEAFSKNAPEELTETVESVGGTSTKK